MDAGFCISFWFGRAVPQKVCPSPFSGDGDCAVGRRKMWRAGHEPWDEGGRKGANKETNERLWAFPAGKSIAYEYAM